MALLESLDERALDWLADQLAERVAARLPPQPGAPAENAWLSTKEAAEHLGLTANALHKLARQGRVPHEQDGPGCKLWFRAAELDAWRRGEASPELRQSPRFQIASKRAA
jgi:excisionase family DNA binding protein